MNHKIEEIYEKLARNVVDSLLEMMNIMQSCVQTQLPKSLDVRDKSHMTCSESSKSTSCRSL